LATGLPVPGRPVARTGPLVLERGRAAISLPAFADRRVVGQAGLVVLMLAALGVLLVARASPPVADRAGGPSSSASPTVLSPAPSVSPTPIPTASRPAPSPTPTVVPSPTAGRPSPSPKPVARTTYRVRAGDTLSSIASRFGTTVDQLRALNNGLGSSSIIRVGEVLRIR
jgi:LysM repeat protein